MSPRRKRVAERSFSSCRFVSGRSQMIWLSCWTWHWERWESRNIRCFSEWKMSPSTASRQVRLSAGGTFEPIECRTLTTRHTFVSGHPRFFNQQYGGVDYHALAGRFLSEALNTNLWGWKSIAFHSLFWPPTKKNDNNQRVTMCVSQFHLRGGPSVCVDGGWGSERVAAAGWLGRGRRAVLSWGVNLQHVCNEPGTLPDVPRCEKSRAVEPPSTYRFHIFTGKQHLPNTAYLKDAAPLEKCSEIFLFVSILMSSQSHYSVQKGAAFLGIGTDNVIVVKVDDG